MNTQVHAGRLLTEAADPTKPALLLHFDSTKAHAIDEHLRTICRTLALVMPVEATEIEARIHLHSVCSSFRTLY